MAIHLVFLFVIGVLYFAYYLLLKNRNYWKSKNIPFVKPLPLFGNYKDCILLKTHINDILDDMCQQFPDEPCFGSFYGTSPALIIQDPNLLKHVLSKDFFYCSGRETSNHNHKETITKNMFMAHGDEWKVLRMNLSPLFSSVKLKSMFHLIKNSSDTLENLLAEEIKTSPNVEIRKLLSRYTIECITGCAFGLRADTMKKDSQKNPFIAMGDQIFDLSDYRATRNICRSMWPGLFYSLGFKLLDDNVDTFFNKLISGVFKNREETKTSKNDFVDLILAWKRHNCITGDSLSHTGDKKVVRIKVNEELLIAQCEILFGAGYETTAVTTSYLLYELAKNKIVQDKVIAEVDEYFTKHERIEYECINMLKYTESCLEECLRLHPIFGFLTREVMHDYSLPTGLCVNKGNCIHIPVLHIHHNPDNFPEPELFRPERFFGELKKNIKPYTYMPFGEGPRICLGMRFAKLPIYAAVLKVFKNYRVELAENMQHKISYNPKSLFVSQPIGGIYVKFIPRKA
ncbi:cytochrome P450 6B4-like [Maniola jurtina]|uniref:cytochrome P450 6B4-like n=1 Tax=Maniola jurtina TaxID=191418 RepID=UPI001E68B21F|nr:cytochrome P450 6B4-like [Maniola jurtina]